MKRFGLIGKPISHSLSPALFRAAYGGRYDYDLIETPDFESAWKEFLEHYDGINVTAPYKEQALEKADILSEECEAIGATNLLIKTPEGIKAYNTDYSAVALMLLELLSKRPLSTALVIGCGGAGKAATVAALEMGLKTSIANRNTGKASEFASGLGEMFGAKKAPKVYPLTELPDADIVLYTLPLKIEGLEKFSETPTIEANYKDPVLNGESGRQWLLSQAVNGYSLFTAEKPDAEAMTRII